MVQALPGESAAEEEGNPGMHFIRHAGEEANESSHDLLIISCN